MRRVTLKLVLDGCATRLGLSAAALQADQAAALAKYLEDRVRDAWERFNWPFTRATEERVFAPRYEDGGLIETGNVVYKDGAYWSAVVGVDENFNAVIEWLADPDFDRCISLEQPGLTPMAEVLEVWDADPTIVKCPGRVPFRIGPNGIEVADDAPDVVWVEFSRYCPRFSTVAWLPDSEYAAGDVVFHGTDCWLAQATSTGSAPAEDNSNWALQVLPHQLSRYAELAAVADCLNESNQHDKAKRMEDLAEERLLDELEKLISKQNQIPRFAVVTQ